MSTLVDFRTPIGRLVGGSLYDPITVDMKGEAKTFKTGVKKGQPRVDYVFQVAIPKGTEQHWAQTEWGAKIWAAGHSGFPQGQANAPTFAWKIVDGDSQVPDAKNRKPCERQGYAGNWILKFATSAGAPTLFNRDGTKQLVEPNAINLGDYVQVFAYVVPNGETMQAGVYLNPKYVALSYYGERITFGPDPSSVGFGNGAMPAGASLTPVAGAFNLALPQMPAPNIPPQNINLPPQMPAPNIPLPNQNLPVPNNIQPYTPILNTPPTPPPTVPLVQVQTRKLTAAANGATYQQLIDIGWTDALLIQHGLMEA